MLPNFLIIGAPRAGTTWLHRNLRDHPDVFMPQRKELHFFDRDYARGMQYYEQCFTGWSGERALGEATPAYLHGQYSKLDIPSLIHSHLPDVRLIAILRNPVDRLYSEYWNVRAKDPRNRHLSFEQKIEQRPQFVREGFYAEQLERYLRLFAREQMLVLFYDDLKRDPGAFLHEVHAFLRIRPAYHSSWENVRVNQAAGKQLLARSRALWYAERALSRLHLRELAKRVRGWNSMPVPPMNPDTRRRLIEIYRPHNERLAELVQRDLSAWNDMEPTDAVTLRRTEQPSRKTQYGT